MDVLKYSKPASLWTEALPLGNGRMGAMHYGGVEQDRIQLNEDTLWSGPSERNVKDDQEALRLVREQIYAGMYEAATETAKRMFGPYTQAYMPLGELQMIYFHGDVAQDYSRKLDISQALSKVNYRIGSVHYEREMFISHPHQVLVMRIKASKPSCLHMQILVNSTLKNRHVHDAGKIVLQGVCPEYCAPYYFSEDELPIVYGEFEQSKAIHFESRLRVQVVDGLVQSAGGKLSISYASEVVVYLSVATSFNGFDQQPGQRFADLSGDNENTLDKAMSLGYEHLKEEHIADYQQYYNRASFTLNQHAPDDEKFVELDTDLYVKHEGAKAAGLVTLLFQYGRYLLISSSRPGTQPANLQGIWNEKTRAPWSSNYTLNINTQMNYWPAESTNLAACHLPLLQAIKEWSITGSQMVKERYGLEGWTLHHNSDLWRQADPVGNQGHGDPVWAFWPMSGPWLCRHLWEHYLYSLDEAFLEDIYPVLEGSVQFCMQWLVEDESGYLITCPSTSPEHSFYSSDGQHGTVTKGATMDLAIIRELFMNYLAAGNILNKSDDNLRKVSETMGRLHPFQIGQYGQLQEWLIDHEDGETGHRHVSHLYGVYPAEVMVDGTYLEAARQTLKRRGDEGTGWSLAWKLCLWARLKDSERIERLMHQLFQIVEENEEVFVGGGLYPNLLGAHPPFQIDGNLGYTAAIVEMLVQSHTGEIELLPALPPSWVEGSVTGLRLRSGIGIDIYWSRGVWNKVNLVSAVQQTIKLRIGSTVSCKIESEEFILEPLQGVVEMKLPSNMTVVIESLHIY